jgi:hypothetical protein
LPTTGIAGYARAASGHAADKRDEFCAAVKQALR